MDTITENTIELSINYKRITSVRAITLTRTGGSEFEITITDEHGNKTRLMRDTSGKLDSLTVLFDTIHNKFVASVAGKGVK